MNIANVLDQMDRPEVMNTSGAYALFLQFGHPLVARGVASTSKFQSDTRSRLRHTSSAIQRLMTSEPSDAKRFACHLARRHDQIQGELSEDVGSWKAGTRYSAADPELLLWVYTTLVVGRVQMFSMLVRPLTEDEQEAFYKSTHAFGEHFGITETLRPATYKELVLYYQHMLTLLAVGKDGRELVGALLTSLGPAAVVLRPLIAEVLPKNIREAYKLPWGQWQKLQAGMYRPLLMKLYTPLQRVVKLWHSLEWSLRSKRAA